MKQMIDPALDTTDLIEWTVHCTDVFVFMSLLPCCTDRQVAEGVQPHNVYCACSCIQLRDPCQEDPCQNGATCVNHGNIRRTCQCANGFEGEACENDIGQSA